MEESTPYSKSGSIIRISYNFDGSNVNLIMNSVSIAYFLGPLLGGEISQYIGFSWLMSVIGLANIFYAFYLIRTVLRPTVYTNDFFFLVFEEKVSILNIHFSFVTHTQGYTETDTSEANNQFFLRLWSSNTTLSSNSSYKRFYDTMDKAQQ